MEIVQSRLSQRWIKGLQPTIEIVRPGTQSELYALYDRRMKFFHSSLKSIRADPQLFEVYKQYRRVLAHADHRRLWTMFVFKLPHTQRPEEFGELSSCDICSKIPEQPVGEHMLSDLKRNGGLFYSSSEDPDNPGHFRTFLQEHRSDCVSVFVSVSALLSLPIAMNL